MIFEALMESMERGELLLLSGVFCRYHVRRDGQLTLHELIVDPRDRRTGKGRSLISRLIETPGIQSIVAWCPADLMGANAFYSAMHFVEREGKTTKTGRRLRQWRLAIEEDARRQAMRYWRYHD